MSRLTLVLDSSQIATLLDCEERWRLLQQEQLIRINPFDPSSTMRPSDAISAGLLIHKLLEIYYGAIGRALGQTEAVRLANEFDPDAEDVADAHEYPIDPEIRQQVYDTFTSYLMFWSQRDYEVSIRYVPFVDIHPVTGLPCDRQRPEALVEQGFSFPLLDTSEYLFVLEGRIDFIGTCGASQHLWMDHKSQSRAHTLYQKSIQFRNYALVTGFDLGVINYIRLTKKVDKTTFVRQPISFSPHETAQWKQELIEMYVGFAKRIQRGELQKNRGACGSGFSPCQFIPICEEYNPIMREQIKKDQFTKRKAWKPW